MNDVTKPISAVAGGVGADLSCRRCGYNLRSLAVDRTCPECDLPIELSAKGESLPDANPHWLLNLVAGLWTIAVGSGLALLQNAWTRWTPWGMPIAVNLGFSLLANFLVCCGILIFSCAEPGEFARTPITRFRKRLRWIVVILLAIHAGCVAAFGLIGPYHAVTMSATLALLGLRIPFAVYAYGYLIVIANRIPDWFCATAAKSLRIIFLFQMLVQIGTFLVLIWPGSGTAFYPGYNFLWNIYGTTYIVEALVSLMLIVVSIRMAYKIQRARRRALATWKASLVQSGS